MTGYKNYKDQKIIKSTVIYVFMIVFALIAVVPVWIMLVNSTRTTEQINAGLAILPSTHALYNWKVLTTHGFQI